MIGWLLNLAYVLFLLLCSPVLLWRSVTQGKYRTGWRQKLWGDVPQLPSNGGPRIWLHAVSVGEVLQLRQVIERLRLQLPTAQIIVSTTTATGYQVAHDKLPAIHAIYFPLDFTWAVTAALRQVQPDIIVLVELELWPNFLRTALRQGIPVGLINGRLSERSFAGYRRLTWLLAPLLQQFSFVAVQSAEYAQRFQQLGVPPERCHITGSIKFDGVQTNRDQPLTAELRSQFAIQPDDIVFIAGSTQEPEERFALEIYRTLKAEFPQLRLILVPRHPERATEIVNLVAASGAALSQRSLSSSGMINPAARPVGLLDTVGELGACWGLADIAFVGGSFGTRGGQNMLEPAAYGAAVCFGPHTKNFRQIVELLTQATAVQVVHSQQELRQFVLNMLQQPTLAHELGQRAKSLVLSQQGATDRTVALIVGVLSARPH